MPKKLDRCIKKVKKKKGIKSAYAICVGNLFKSTTFNKSHKHKWMKGRGYTTITDGHSHKINIKKRLGLQNNNHTHRLLNK